MEKIFSVLIMLIGALMHAVVFGNVTAIISVGHSHQSQIIWFWLLLANLCSKKSIWYKDARHERIFSIRSDQQVLAKKIDRLFQCDLEQTKGFKLKIAMNDCISRKFELFLGNATSNFNYSNFSGQSTRRNSPTFAQRIRQSASFSVYIAGC